MKELSDVIFAVSDAISTAIDAGAMPAARELQKINRDLLAKDHVIGIGQPESQTKPENSWHERGERPPVGVECEAVINGSNHEVCTVIAYFDDMVWLSAGNEKHLVRIADKCKFRPIKTQREKFVDAALAEFDKKSDKYPPTKSEWLTKLFGEMYDVGCRFVSQESRS